MHLPLPRARESCADLLDFGAVATSTEDYDGLFIEKYQLLPNCVESAAMELESPKEATPSQTTIARLQKYFMERLNNVKSLLLKEKKVFITVSKYNKV
mmetsp:Transcript_36907/g.44484  ORF Transcript_36907/g.44484 Transcript_36907/m.44484 type:complete len:98 (-) Transcript_36907:23-316(-)